MNQFVTNGLAYISAEQDARMANSRVQPHDVLLNITGASIGRVCVVPDEICPANVNQHVSIIRVKDQLNPSFLAHFLASPLFQEFIMANQSGATRQALTKVQIENFSVPFPSFSVQKSIVDLLQKQSLTTQETARKLKSQLQTINELPAAFLKKAFAGGM